MAEPSVIVADADNFSRVPPGRDLADMPALLHAPLPARLWSPARLLARRRAALVLASLVAMCGTWPAAAQNDPRPQGPAGGAFWAAGPTLVERQSVDTRDLRGNVVMVFYWSTSCTVCLQKMGELRANAAGWRGQPFQLVLISVDRTPADLDSYVRTVRLMDPRGPVLPVLWAGDPAYSHTLPSPPARLPMTLVLDTKGEVVQRHEGRMAPEAWDTVAELMP